MECLNLVLLKIVRRTRKVFLGLSLIFTFAFSWEIVTFLLYLRKLRGKLRRQKYLPWLFNTSTKFKYG